MKKIFIFFAFIITQVAYCQTPILPLSTYENIPSGAYLKDLDNVLLPYVGTWEGTLDNKKYTFVFTKFPQYDKFGEYYEDVLKCKFKVTDLVTGTIIYDNLSAINYDDHMILAATSHRGLLHCFFTDTDANCKNGLEFYIRNINGQPNKMTYCYFRYSESWGGLSIGLDCINYSDRMNIPVFLPKQDLILTKI